MKPKQLLLLAPLGVLLTAVWAATRTAASTAATADLVARGRHLVENVALCADCHSPRLPTGELDRSRWLLGAPIGFKPTVEMPWAPVAPPLAGLPGYTDEQAVTLLTTGVRHDGRPPLPPMPGFKLTRDEALAVVAYLRAVAPVR